MFKENSPMASQLLTKHNVFYMMTLMRTMRKTIMTGDEAFEQFVKEFLSLQFPKGNIPLWVVDALGEAGIEVTTTLTKEENNNKTQSDGGAVEEDNEDDDIMR
jgi:hypothetical protein